ncbi:MAG: permease, partial [Candidatus Krumholzibacteria bacterium]|nr:permease [Candidatus Krumholzibacteria bacterium]
MLRVGQEIIRILNESSVYLLLGFTLAGLLHVLMQRFPRATGALTGKGKRPVFLASLIGLPMPLCSCGVLPAALALRKNGASKGATASFLVSVPETDVVSILLTLALMGPLMAIFRPAAALVTAVAAGLLVNWVDSKTTAPNPIKATTGGCRHDDGGEHSDSTAQPCHCSEESTESKPKQERSWLVRALHFGFVEIFDDVVVQLVIGFALAGV